MHSHPGSAPYWLAESQICGAFYCGTWHGTGLSLASENSSVHRLSLSLFSCHFSETTSHIFLRKEEPFCLKDDFRSGSLKNTLAESFYGNQVESEMPPVASAVPSTSAQALMNHFHLYHKLGSQVRVLFLDKNTRPREIRTWGDLSSRSDCLCLSGADRMRV